MNDVVENGVPGTDAARVGLATKLKFHVASYVRTQMYISSSAVFGRNGFLLGVKNGTRLGHRAHHLSAGSPPGAWAREPSGDCLTNGTQQPSAHCTEAGVSRRRMLRRPVDLLK